MTRIELIYDEDCPNVAATRKGLHEALERVGLAPHWREWNRAAPETPAHLRHYGSPTILINGEDLTKIGSANGNCCRLYQNEQGQLAGTPSVAAITMALQRAKTRT